MVFCWLECLVEAIRRWLVATSGPYIFSHLQAHYFNLSSQHVMYQIQTILHPKLTRNCTATKLTQPFRKMIIPPDAIHSFAGYLGAAAGGGKGVLIDVFVGEIKEQKSKLHSRQCSVLSCQFQGLPRTFNLWSCESIGTAYLWSFACSA